ncbi:hypothetical protein DFJ74DRAFT_669949 [Hyaloraphidium curvatum]|nr:hypothetical protein DFJ74DRAFT_669949 [Hyaloraphidium curvatum]
MAFWGLVVYPNKSYTQTVDQPFRITMAALGEAPAAGRHTVTVTVDDDTYVLCSLTTDKVEQQQLDLVFGEGEDITIKMNGPSPIHLTGTFLLDDEEPDFSDFDDESIDSDDLMIEGEDGEEDSENEVERMPPGKVKVLGEDDESGSEEESGEEGSGDGDEDSEESEEEQPAPKGKAEKPKGKAEKGAQKPEVKRKAESGQTPQQPPKKQKVEDGAASQKATPAAKPQKADGQQSGKQTPAETKGTPANVQKEASKPGTATKAGDNKSKPATPATDTDKTPKKKTLPSGLVIEDKVVGSGAKAKNGKTLALRYIGKLASGKVFDSNTSGNPFKVQLGKGSVIKGWEVGLQGMNAGGTRVLGIPPNLAYGAKGAPPDIPPNSTLTFEIKLLSVD